MISLTYRDTVGVAQLVERWIVVPVAVGSNPTTHPKKKAVLQKQFCRRNRTNRQSTRSLFSFQSEHFADEPNLSNDIPFW